MESSFVWILMFAGAAVALLGIFLVASERELKAKRREIESLVARLEGQPGLAAAAESSQAGDSGDLLARNRELEDEIKTLSEELTQARRATEELPAMQAEVGKLEDRLRQLSSANEELRGRFAASQADLESARRDESGPALGRMQAEIDGLRLALQTSRAQVTELEQARKNLPDLNVIAAEREAERQEFQSRIQDFEKRLADQQEEHAEMQTLRQRIADSESTQQALRDEISGYENEIPRWQARLAATEEAARRLAAIRDPYQELLGRHAEIADRQRRLQDELIALAGQITGTAVDATQTAEVSGSVKTAGGDDMMGSSAPKLVPFQENANAGAAAPMEPAAAPGTDSRTHRFGVLCALLFIGATATVGIQFLGSEWEQSAVEIAAAKPPPSPARSESPAPALDEKQMTIAELATPSPAVAETPKPSPPKSAPIVSPPAARAADVSSAGTYRVIHSSRVYAAPTELARALGDIEPGVNVNVVNARDGWLEIHSKHGRPPGFIRREVAARIHGAD